MTRLRTIALSALLLGFAAYNQPLPMAAQQLVFEAFPAAALVRGENVWLRLDPTTDTEVVTLLQRGDPVTITGESVVEGDDEFYPVEADLTGETGWMRALFIDPRSIAGTSTVVVPLDEVDGAPEDVAVVDEPANQRQQDREARRQARQANAELEPEPETADPDADRAARQAARQANSEATAAEEDPPADDRAARRAARQAGQDGNAEGANASGDALTFSGSEPTVTPEFTAPSDVLTVTASHEGDGNFIVSAITPDGSEPSLFNEIGPFSGETSFEIEAGSTVILDVEANGPWEVVIEPAF